MQKKILAHFAHRDSKTPGLTGLTVSKKHRVTRPWGNSVFPSKLLMVTARFLYIEFYNTLLTNVEPNI